MTKKHLVFLILAITVFSGCTPKRTTDDKPIVTVSILPFRYFAEQLGGDQFTINVLVPPGVSHHNYDPAPRQLERLEKSKVLFINGQLGFEKIWVPKMRSNYNNLTIVDLSAGMNLITAEGGEGGHDHEAMTKGQEEDHDHEGVDPHYWLSVPEARQLAASMAIGLIQADPACRQLIEDNLIRLTARIDSLGAAMDQKLSNLSHRSFLIYHPALTYLARDYSLHQHAMELGGKEPTASHFKELVNLAESEKINTIFIQKEYDQENARSLSRETGSKIVVIDPMSPDWFSEMEHLAGSLAEMDRK